MDSLGIKQFSQVSESAPCKEGHRKQNQEKALVIDTQNVGRQLLVQCIPAHLSQSKLRSLFEEFGEIQDMCLSPVMQGCATCTYFDLRSAFEAYQSFRGVGQQLQVTFANCESGSQLEQGILVVSNQNAKYSNEQLQHIFQQLFGPVRCVVGAASEENKLVEFFDVRHAQTALMSLQQSSHSSSIDNKFKQLAYGVAEIQNSSISESSVDGIQLVQQGLHSSPSTSSSSLNTATLSLEQPAWSTPPNSTAPLAPTQAQTKPTLFDASTMQTPNSGQEGQSGHYMTSSDSTSSIVTAVQPALLPSIPTSAQQAQQTASTASTQISGQINRSTNDVHDFTELYQSSSADPYSTSSTDPYSTTSTDCQQSMINSSSLNGCEQLVSPLFGQHGLVTGKKAATGADFAYSGSNEANGNCMYLQQNNDGQQTNKQGLTSSLSVDNGLMRDPSSTTDCLQWYNAILGSEQPSSEGVYGQAGSSVTSHGRPDSCNANQQNSSMNNNINGLLSANQLQDGDCLSNLLSGSTIPQEANNHNLNQYNTVTNQNTLNNTLAQSLLSPNSNGIGVGNKQGVYPGSTDSSVTHGFVNVGALAADTTTTAIDQLNENDDTVNNLSQLLQSVQISGSNGVNGFGVVGNPVGNPVAPPSTLTTQNNAFGQQNMSQSSHVAALQAAIQQQQFQKLAEQLSNNNENGALRAAASPANLAAPGGLVNNSLMQPGSQLPNQQALKVLAYMQQVQQQNGSVGGMQNQVQSTGQDSSIDQYILNQLVQQQAYKRMQNPNQLLQLTLLQAQEQYQQKLVAAQLEAAIRNHSYSATPYMEQLKRQTRRLSSDGQRGVDGYRGGRTGKRAVDPAMEAERKAHQVRMYALDVEKVRSGDDKRTTLMIKNIPNKYDQQMLLDTINAYMCQGSYDFLYLPIDFKNRCNVGYAFINMTCTDYVVPLFETFNVRRWERFNSEKIAVVTYARIQGRQALVDHFRNSSLLHEDKRCQPVLFGGEGGTPLQVPFPTPDQHVGV